MLSKRIANITPSATHAMTARIAEKRAAGEDIITFSIGEPDGPTPQPIVDACEQALWEGNYTVWDLRWSGPVDPALWLCAGRLRILPERWPAGPPGLAEYRPRQRGYDHDEYLGRPESGFQGQ